MYLAACGLKNSRTIQETVGLSIFTQAESTPLPPLLPLLPSP